MVYEGRDVCLLGGLSAAVWEVVWGVGGFEVWVFGEGGGETSILKGNGNGNGER